MSCQQNRFTLECDMNLILTFCVLSRYSVVRFITEKNRPSCVVPNCWVHRVEDQDYCYFPKHWTGERLTEAIKTQMAPDPMNTRFWWDKMVMIKFRNGKLPIHIFPGFIACLA